MNQLKIFIGNDHAGVLYKENIVAFLKSKNIEVENFGANSPDSVDYPDFAHPVSKKVGETNGMGILICGSGNGVCMSANKHRNIRAALCWTNELAELARTHNNANILCIPARFVSENLALDMVKTFLKTSFEGGRHERRVEKINC